MVIVAGIIARHGLSGLLMVTTMAGDPACTGLNGLGTAVRFIPRPIIIGFTNGIALLIASTQIKHFLGLKMKENPSEFIARINAIAGHLYTFDWVTFDLALGSLSLIFLMPKWAPRLPGSIVALLAGTTAIAIFQLPVETIGSKFGGIPQGLPAFNLPAFRPDLIIPCCLPHC